MVLTLVVAADLFGDVVLGLELEEGLEGEICGNTTWSGLTDPPVIPELEEGGTDEIDLAKVVVVDGTTLEIPRLLSAEVFTVEGSDEKALMAMSDIARIRIAPLPAALLERCVLVEIASLSR